MKNHLIFTLFCLSALSAVAQQRKEVLEYIETYNSIAIDEMIRAKVPASITLAQGILESGSGKSPLSVKANNHFGIKCKEEWTGGKYYHDDDAPQECFRVYSSASESYVDHSDFLANRPRYVGLFQLPITDYKSWAHALKSAGYATNPKYASMLIQYIEDYNLAQYDQVAMVKLEQKETAPKVLEKTEPLVAKGESKVIVSDVKNHDQSKHFAIEIKNQDKGRKEVVINGVRATVAQGNEDPLKIALEYNIDYNWIMAFNDLTTGDRFKEGQYIYLQAKKNRGLEARHTVKAGESMHDIAQKNGIKLKELYLKNLMRQNDQPLAGEELYLHDKRIQSPRTMAYADFLRQQDRANENKPKPLPADQGSGSISNEVPILPNINRFTETVNYEVQPSDTLYSIAKKFNTSVDKIQRMNKMAVQNVYVGQTLVVSQ
jgi:LysM repeat protein